MLSMLVIATTNENKLKEFKEILGGLDIEILSLSDFGPIPPVIEDGDSFDENAYKKALHTAKVLGLPAIADDSGLVVDALGGAPGIYSARYAGEDATDEKNRKKLLDSLKTEKNRAAHFQCVISIATPGGPALTYEASCDGEIIDEEKGDNGFGYDPIFFFPELGKTFAQMESYEKHQVSHRGKALAEVKAELPMIKKWLEQRILEQKPEKPDHDDFKDNDWSK